MSILKETKNKIIFILCFFIVSFTAEFFYRDPIFDHSVSTAKKIQDKLSFSKTFFKYYSHLGIIDVFWVFLIFLFCPISYCYSIFLNYIISVHLCNFMKLIYGQGRPFLLDDKDSEEIKKVCEGGFGNPSGHSFESTSMFLSFSQLIIDFLELGKKPSIIIYSVVAFLILLINFSRVILGAHSFNQVIFGDTIGFTIYFIIFQIIKPHLRKGKIFFERFLNVKYIIFNVILFFIVIFYIILGAILFDRDGEDDYESFRKKLKYLCDYKDNQILTRISVFKSLYITGYFGMVFGLNILSNIIKRDFNSRYEDANHYYLNINKKWYVVYGIKFLILLLCYIPFTATLLQPDNININGLYIVGSAVPMFIFGFLLFGPNFIFNFSFRLVNPYIETPINNNEIEYELSEP